jgi:nitroreductase
MNDTLNSIFTRYSCRAFSDKAIAREELEMLTKAAVAAPSGVNRQLWRVIAVTDKTLIGDLEAEGLRIMSEYPDKSMYERIMSRGGKLFYGAPCIIVVPVAKVSPVGEAIPPGAELFDCGILAENVCLAAASLGIDSCMCGFTAFAFAGERREEFKKRLGFPEGYEIGIGILLGYGEKQGKPHEPDLTKISYI